MNRLFTAMLLFLVASVASASGDFTASYAEKSILKIFGTVLDQHSVVLLEANYYLGKNKEWFAYAGTSQEINPSNRVPGDEGEWYDLIALRTVTGPLMAGLEVFHIPSKRGLPHFTYLQPQIYLYLKYAVVGAQIIRPIDTTDENDRAMVYAEGILTKTFAEDRVSVTLKPGASYGDSGGGRKTIYLDSQAELGIDENKSFSLIARFIVGRTWYADAPDPVDMKPTWTVGLKTAW